MNLLSLDLSSKSTGWAVFIDGKLTDSGVVAAVSQDVVKRIHKITKELYYLVKQYNISNVILEEVLPAVGHNSNTNVWKALTWMQASVVFMLHDNFTDIKYEFIMPNSWRSYIGIKTGKGKTREVLKKADMEYVKNTFHMETKTDDEADAICLGCGYLNKINNEINW